VVWAVGVRRAVACWKAHEGGVVGVDGWGDWDGEGDDGGDDGGLGLGGRLVT
jgi:hypothetical protein